MYKLSCTGCALACHWAARYDGREEALQAREKRRRMGIALGHCRRQGGVQVRAIAATEPKSTI